MAKIPEKYLLISLFGTGTENPEIVEISCFLIDALRLDIEDHQFHAYVKPFELDNPVEDYLKKTGVRPYAVIQAENRFKEVLFQFNTWLDERKVYKDETSVTVTEWGKSFGELLTAQCKRSTIQIPWWGRQWFCLRREFVSTFELTEPPERVDLDKMIRHADIQYEGKKNSSWDQAFNTAIVCNHILRKGAGFQHKEAVEDILL